MNPRNGIVVAVILALVVIVVAWSKLRYAGSESFEQPQRWKEGEHPRLEQQAAKDG